MPGASVEMEPVEPKSVKNLSLKSIQRALDRFAPTHDLAPPDPERYLSLFLLIFLDECENFSFPSS